MERDDRSPYSQGLAHIKIRDVLKPLIRMAARTALVVIEEPTEYNVLLPNSRRLVRMRDYFLSLEKNLSREKEIRGIWNAVIAIYDYDRYYRERIDWVLIMILGEGWEPADGALEPRPDWWGHKILCPLCGQEKGGRRVFADCPKEYHI